MFNVVRNGYYGNLVVMVRDVLFVEELVRIDCIGFDKSDYKKIGVKFRVIFFCLFDIVIYIWNFFI